MGIMCSLLSLPKQWWYVLVTTVSVVTILWDNNQKKLRCHYRKFQPNNVVTVLVVTILDTFEPSLKMLISRWLAGTVLNSSIQTKCYGITSKKVCLIAEKRCWVVMFLKVTHRFFRLLNPFTSRWWDLSTHTMYLWERETQEYFLNINVWV